MEKCNDKSYILQLLKERNIKEHSFKEIIMYSSKLLESLDYLQKECIQQHLQSVKVNSNSVESADESKLKEKCSSFQKELAECHIKISRLADQVITLRDELNEKNTIIAQLNSEIKQFQSDLKSNQEENTVHKAETAFLKSTLQDRMDEYDTLNITYSSLENKWNLLDIENKKLKAQIQMLMENERSPSCESLPPVLSTSPSNCSGDCSDLTLRKESVEEIKSASKLTSEANFYSNSSLPQKIKCEFSAHDSDINAVMWLPDSAHILTAGSDRRVKLWEIREDDVNLNYVARDCNSAVLSIDVDLETRFVLCASCDFASRVWTISDFSLKHTLTGHSGKVVSSKFLKDQCKIVSGSTDQTLKLWDFGRRVCTVTYSTHSAVNDVLSKNSTCIISGHSDNKIRFWDTRLDCETSNLQASGRVASLDLSSDGIYLLASEDNKLKLYDARNNKEINAMSAKNFVIGSWTKAKLSPNNKYCCCGSKNGSIFIWNSFTGTLEKELKADNSNVLSCSWSSCGTYLATCGSNKKCTIWSK